MENKKKETWKKPELIIINRCYVEENVLANCNEASDGTCHAQSYTPITS